MCILEITEEPADFSVADPLPYCVVGCIGKLLKDLFGNSQVSNKQYLDIMKAICPDGYMSLCDEVSVRKNSF